MSIPDSLTKCIEPQNDTFGDYTRQATDLAKATGMDQTCVKESETQALTFSGSAAVPFAEANIGITAFNNAMRQSGCSQVTVNLTNQRNAISTINCQIQKSRSSVIGNISSGNSIILETLPLSDTEAKLKAQTENNMVKAQNDLALAIINANLDSQKTQLLKDLMASTQATYQAVLNSYNRDITINKTAIVQSAVSNMKGTITISTEAAVDIKNAQSALAKSVAENDLKQKLGVNSLTDSQKSVLSTNIDNSSQFTQQNVQDTANQIQLSIQSNNSLVLKAAGNIDINNTVIDQNLVSTMVIDALIGQSLTTALVASSSVVSDTVSKAATGADVAGLNDLVDSMGNANAKMKASSSSGMIIVAIIILFIIGLIAGVFKLGGSVLQKGFNNILVILALASLITGIIYFTKGGVGNIILGSILVCFAIGLIIFSFVMRSRLAVMAPVV